MRLNVPMTTPSNSLKRRFFRSKSVRRFMKTDQVPCIKWLATSTSSTASQIQPRFTVKASSDFRENQTRKREAETRLASPNAALVHLAIR